MLYAFYVSVCFCLCLFLRKAKDPYSCEFSTFHSSGREAGFSHERTYHARDRLRDETRDATLYYVQLSPIYRSLLFEVL